MLVDRGLAGRPIMTTIETHWWRGPDYYAVPWRGKWATEFGGGLLGHAIHAHDMLNYVHGPFAEVFAFGATLVNPSRSRIPRRSGADGERLARDACR